MLRRRSPLRLAGLLLFLVAAVAAFLWITPSGSYLFLPDRARPVAPIVQVRGGKNPTDGGGIYLVDVFVRKASLFERLFPGIREGSTLVPGSAIQQPGQSESARRQADLREMSRSQEIAAAVAERAAGYKVVARPTGALIDQVIPGAPASGRLQPTDVIVGVDGRPVRLATDLRRALRSRPVGTRFRLAVHRGSRLLRIPVKTVADPHAGGRPVIGVLVEQSADVHLPVPVRIRSGDIGGPSAGLAFALAVAEKLGRDVDHGQRVAATGEITLDGHVLPIGGVEQKTIGVRRTGIHIFLVPAGDNAREAKKYARGVRIVPVETFQQALRALATIR